MTSKRGVYEYVLTGNERISIRVFDKSDARTAYERQKGVCPYCRKHFEFEEMQADHVIPWSKGGRTVSDNCQMLCRDCNLKKSNKWPPHLPAEMLSNELRAILRASKFARWSGLGPRPKVAGDTILRGRFLAAPS